MASIGLFEPIVSYPKAFDPAKSPEESGFWTLRGFFSSVASIKLFEPIRLIQPGGVVPCQPGREVERGDHLGARSGRAAILKRSVFAEAQRHGLGFTVLIEGTVKFVEPTNRILDPAEVCRLEERQHVGEAQRTQRSA